MHIKFIQNIIDKLRGKKKTKIIHDFVLHEEAKIEAFYVNTK